MSDCKCTATEANKPMQSNGCTIHDKAPYRCEYVTIDNKQCTCSDYIPRVPFNPSTAKSWPVCQCGHVAEEHN